MKWFVILLLLGNVLVFGWGFNERLRDATEARAGTPDLLRGAPKLRLLSELSELPPEREDALAAGGPEAEEGAESDAPLVQAVDLSTEINSIGNASDVCVRIGPIADDQQVVRLRAWLRDRTTAVHTRAETVRERRFFWVYLEPVSDEQAKQSLNDLKKRGVTDYMLIHRGGLKNAISLGLFRSQDSVNRRLAEMTKQGYKPVVVPKFETTESYWVRATMTQGAEDISTIPEDLSAEASVEKIECSNIKAAVAPQ